jgi:hypothetical protein
MSLGRTHSANRRSKTPFVSAVCALARFVELPDCTPQMAALTIHGLRAAAIPLLQAVSITDRTSGKTIVDTDSGPRPGGRPPGPGTSETRQADAQGTIRMSVHGPRGEVNGVLLTDGTVLRLPPDAALNLTSLLQPAAVILLSQSFWPVALSQVATAVAGAAIGPAVSGITLGMFRQVGFIRQTGINQAYNHAGNAVGADLSLQVIRGSIRSEAPCRALRREMLVLAGRRPVCACVGNGTEIATVCPECSLQPQGSRFVQAWRARI